jgi:hypothetical protein
MCHRHHVETDDVAEWTVERLRAMKSAHECRFHEGGPTFADAILEQVAEELDDYWSRVQRAHDTEHVVDDLKLPFEFGKPIEALFKDACDAANRLVDSTQGLEEGAINKVKSVLSEHFGVSGDALDGVLAATRFYESVNFEARALAIPNWHTQLLALLLHIETRYADLQLRLTPRDPVARAKFEALKNRLLQAATQWGLAD